MKELDNIMLEKVCGGNKGDAAKDKDHTYPMYHEGQEVRVYDTVLHLHTTKVTIQSMEWDNKKNCWLYNTNSNSHLCKQINADLIRR